MVVDERIRLILRFVVIGAVIGAGYGYWTSIAAAAGLRGLIRGALTGVLIGAAVSSLRVFVLQAPGTRLARASFMVTVAVRSLVYLVIFLAAIAIERVQQVKSCGWAVYHGCGDGVIEYHHGVGRHAF